MGTCLQYSLDFCLAWARIGEWTSCVLFPVPKGPWPRHGHAGALLQKYQSCSPRIAAWTRAAFEQGVLPSLLLLPGIAPVFSLPGYRMFQTTGLMTGHQRPAIMHAYGGAKMEMDRALATIVTEGWIPMAAAMLGTANRPSMWASAGLRPVAGTTIDFTALSERQRTWWAVLSYFPEAEFQCPRSSWSIPSCPPVHIGRSLGTWPLSKSYQPVCAANPHVWVSCWSHFGNLLSLGNRTPPW